VNGLDARSLVTHLVRHPGEIPLVTGRQYWQFRLATATGSATGTTSVREVIEYAKWSDQQRTGR
jgi:hypothetical protein